MKHFPAICAFLWLALGSCRQDMYNQPKAKTYSVSDLFPDGASARVIPKNTIEYRHDQPNEPFLTGPRQETLVTRLPVPLTPELLKRGQDRYQIYCAVCHGKTGEGNGEIVHRGYPAPPTYHSDRLRNAAVGHFYDTITNGYGTMYSYAARVEPKDRWAIAAYIRALQLSQNATLNDLTPDQRKRLEDGR